MRTGRGAIVAGLFCAWLIPAVGAAASTMAEQQALKSRIEARFKPSASRAGVVLVPKRSVPGITAIEVADGSVSLDGLVVTGGELRQRLGADANAVLELSYLDAPTLRSLFGAGASAAPPVTVSPTPDRDRAYDPWDDRPARRWNRARHGARIRLGENIVVAEDETTTDALVAIAGSITIDGRAESDVVAVGGSVRLGPKAVVRGDVTAVGGRVTSQAGAEVRGRINEITFPHAGTWRGPIVEWRGIDWGIGRWLALAGTMLRAGVILFLVALIAGIARAPAEAAGRRVAAAPWAALFVGVGVQVLFVPAMVALVAALLISIVGIPLLVLVPFVMFGALALAFVGFAAVAMRVGSIVAPRMESPGAVAPALLGALVLMGVTLVARAIALAPGPFGWLAVSTGALGFAIEYIAWTIGLGAAAIALFEWRRQPGVPPVPRGL